MTSEPIPQGSYRTAVTHGDLVYTAGMTPRVEGELLVSGRIGAQVDPDAATAAIELATRNAIAAVDAVRGSRAVERVLQLTVYMTCDGDFTDHSRLADSASAILFDTWPSAGLGARAAVGVSTLPGGAPVEIQLVVALAAATDSAACDARVRPCGPA